MLGIWLPGAIHIHANISDGKLPLSEVKRDPKGMGGKYRILLIPGGEGANNWRGYHTLAIYKRDSYLSRQERRANRGN